MVVVLNVLASNTQIVDEVMKSYHIEFILNTQEDIDEMLPGRKSLLTYL